LQCFLQGAFFFSVAESPINRRISIVIMNKRTEEALLADGKTVDVESAQEVQEGVLGTASAATSASAAPPDHIP